MKADRTPMLRRASGDKESMAMNLPADKTCADCVHCPRCCAIFGHIPQDQVCDWYPSRFQPAEVPPNSICPAPDPTNQRPNMEHTPKRYTQDTPAPLRRDGETVEAYRVRCGWDAPKTDALQRYGADLSDFSYSQERVRQMLDEAHAHYEAQVRPLAGMARPGAQWPLVMGDARIDAMASAGQVKLLTAALAKADTRIEALVDAMKSAARTLEGAYLLDGQEVAYVVAKGLRRAAE